jgi:phosphate transport system protein
MATTAPLRPRERLQGLEIDLAQMAGLVESQLAECVGAFERRDVAAAERVIRLDERIDATHQSIDAKVMSLLLGGPYDAATLREIMTHMKLAGELERIGDMSKNVAKRTLVVARESPAKPYAGVARMGRASLRQISDILNAFAARNLEAAKAVWGGDDDLDELYNSVYREILESMMAGSAAVNAGAHLLFIAKNFERVGDHATNIAEALHFLVTGSALIVERPKGDQTSATTASTLKGP